MASKSGPGKIQQRFTRMIARVPWLRRRYARYVLRYIEKSRKKGRDLPPELAQLDRQLIRVPPSKRAELLETALVTGNDPSAASSRAMRRALARQSRQRSSGKGQRPGTVGGSRVIERR
jgi:predicted alpha/beta-hydrolase family hydrolase